jgi:hypothetical protein
VNRRALPWIGGLLVVSAVVDVLIGYAPIPAYGALIGIVGVVLITVVSKTYGSRVVQRPPEYLGVDAPRKVQPEVIGDPTHPDALPVGVDPATLDDPGLDDPGPDDPGLDAASRMDAVARGEADEEGGRG